MRLVPRQLKRDSLTGSEPYYGGRLTPAQATAASHPNSAQSVGSSAQPTPTLTERLTALQQLLDSGVITTEEFADLKAQILA